MPSEYMHFDEISNPFCSFCIVIFLFRMRITFFVTFFKAYILKLTKKLSLQKQIQKHWHIKAFLTIIHVFQ